MSTSLTFLLWQRTQISRNDPSSGTSPTRFGTRFAGRREIHREIHLQVPRRRPRNEDPDPRIKRPPGVRHTYRDNTNGLVIAELAAAGASAASRGPRRRRTTRAHRRRTLDFRGGHATYRLQGPRSISSAQTPIGKDPGSHRCWVSDAGGLALTSCKTLTTYCPCRRVSLKRSIS